MDEPRISRNFYTNLPSSPLPREGFSQFIRRHAENPQIIIDIGAAAGGLLSKTFRGDTHRLIALDHNLALLASAPKLAHPVAADFDQALPFANKIFDCAILSFSIHLASDCTALVREVYRIIRPGGQVFILTCSESNLSGRLMNRFIPRLKTMDLLRYKGLARVKQLLLIAGFRIESIENIALGKVLIDRSYAKELEHRTWSSFALLSEEERRDGISLLDEFATSLHIQHKVLRLPWIRTGIAARKPLNL